MFPAWLSTKRPFMREEIVGSYMLKLGELCGGYLVRFNADGTVTERFACFVRRRVDVSLDAR